MLSAGDLILLWSPAKGDSFLVRLTPGSTQGSHLGQMKHDDIIGMEYGDVINTNKMEPFFILRPSIGEYARRIKRQTQVIFPKDSGFIIQHLNFGPGALIVECGTGSGGLTSVFAHFVGDSGRVVTYDRREEFSRLAESNAERWGVRHRIEFKVRDISDGFDERNADAVFLDVRNPWDFIGTASEALAWGHRLGVLIPTFNQMEKTLIALREHSFVDALVLELLLRYFKTEPDRIRPDDTMTAHTGFLIFASKARPLSVRHDAATAPEACESRIDTESGAVGGEEPNRGAGTE
ncbi:MAG: tRNA (adenine-N1)-methyltransferase [Synergistaceae bacterium]|jgi:tRNA (adenine57-N1/adenine58-N1)-methyltransferase|nr:tRNA (adenine-N1)-methyltransferase [Synergistaceae bacterium]